MDSQQKQSADKPKKKKIGRPTKATPELLERIVEDIAAGLTDEQACAANGVSVRQLYEWQKKPEFPQLRARKEAARIKDMQARIEACDSGSGDWKRFQWFLKCKFPNQFGDQPLVALTQNNYQISEERAREIDARVKRLRGENRVGTP
jgi:hypothetical protein